MRWFACPICTAIGRDRALCDFCAEELYRKREPIVRDLGAYVVRSLFAWRKDDWLGLRWWALALKRKEADAFWREAATWSIDLHGALDADVEIVPIPTSRPSYHARGFADALARRSAAAVRDVLEVKSTRSQRRLARAERRARRFHVRDDFTARERIVVVDDIATSGATIEAAYRALGQPARFEAWCLMDRRPR